MEGEDAATDPLRADRPEPPQGRQPRARPRPARRCPSRARATSSSTSRATRSRSTTASTTCSASSSPACRTPTASRPSTPSGRATTTARVTLDAEKRAFERLIDLFMDRLGQDPAIHIYHYAPYEPTALGRLMGRHGTREDEVDRLLRGDVLVDLYRVVRQGVRASVESYSIKRLEPLYGFTREVDLRDAGSSIVAFEAWLQVGGEAGHDDEALRADRALQPRRRRLDPAAARLARRPARGAGRAASAPPLPRPPAQVRRGPRRTRRDAGAAWRRSRTALTEGVPGRRAGAHAPSSTRRWLLAQLLVLAPPRGEGVLVALLPPDGRPHRRGAGRRARADGGLEYVGVVGRRSRDRIVHRYRFPPQEHAIRAGVTRRRSSDGKVRRARSSRVDDAAGTDRPAARAISSDAPHPTSLVPCDFVATKEQQREPPAHRRVGGRARDRRGRARTGRRATCCCGGRRGPARPPGAPLQRGRRGSGRRPRSAWPRPSTRARCRSRVRRAPARPTPARGWSWPSSPPGARSASPRTATR